MLDQTLSQEANSSFDDICSIDPAESLSGAAQSPAKASLSESDDGYVNVIARLNSRWRIIECKDSVQWVLQQKLDTTSRGWRGQSFCQTRPALFRCVADKVVGVIDPLATAALNILPQKIEGGVNE